MSLNTPLARVRGHGSAKEGAHHWWMQRLTALLLVPLLVWFVGSMTVAATGDYASVVAWVRSPVIAGALLLLVVAMFYHAMLGLQVVIEDYVSSEGLQVGAIVVMRFLMVLLAAISLVAVLKVALGGQ